MLLVLGMSALARATRSYRVGASYDVLLLSVAAIEGTIHGESQAVAVGKIGGWSGIAAVGVLVGCSVRAVAACAPMQGQPYTARSNRACLSVTNVMAAGCKQRLAPD